MATSKPFEKQSNNSRGGARKGAGRKKGQPNRRTVETQAQAAEGGLTPLEYLLDVMRNGADEKLRFAAANAAAPYVHAKLSSIEMNANVTNHEAALDELE